VRNERRRAGWKRDGEALKIGAPPGISNFPSRISPVFPFFFPFFFRFRFPPPCPPLSLPLSRTSPYFFTTQPISSFLPRNSSVL